MRKILFLSAILSLIITSFSCQTASKSASGKLLKFNLEKGKSYDYEIVWDLDQKMGGQGTLIGITGLYSIDITEDNGTTKTMTGMYRNFKMSIDVPGMKMELDTEKPVEEASSSDMQGMVKSMMGKAFKAIIGKPFTMKVNSKGEITEVSGFDAMIRSMVDSMGLDEQARMGVEASMKEQFNDKSLRDAFTQVFTIFPDKEVKVGDTWTKNYEIGGKLAAKYDNKYTVKEIDGDLVTLDVKSKIDAPDNESKISGDQTGTLVVDSKTGLVMNADFSQDMKVETQGMTVDVKGKGKIRGKATN